MARQILLVDDDRVSRLLTQTVLERLGYEVTVLNDGRDAADAVTAGNFAAVVMDCQMPHMDVFQATAEIRRRESSSPGTHTPILGLSARDMRGDEEAALAKGMDAYVTKPVRGRKLEVALQALLGDT